MPESGISIYCDGACSANGTEYSVGGWSYRILFDSGVETISWGSETLSTNQKMELTSVCEALSYLLSIGCKKEHVTVYSDSAYVVNSINKKWIYNWRRNGWVGSHNKPVKNKELFEKLYGLIYEFDNNVIFKKVKGHSGDKNNEIVDKLAKNAIVCRKQEDEEFYN